MKPFLVSLLAIVSLASIASAAPDALRCSVVADDFEARPARISQLDGQKIAYVDATSGASQTLPLDRLVRLESFPQPEAKPKVGASNSYLIVLRDGQRWVGTPGKLVGDDLEWSAPGLFDSKQSNGVGRVALKSVIAIASVGKSSLSELDRLATTPATQAADELRLTNGDVVTGVVSASDGKTLTSAAPDGQSVTVDWSNVRVVRFAEVSGNTAPQPASFRLWLRDGRIVDGTQLSIEGDRAVFSTTHGGRLELTGDAIIAIEHRGGRARMLANLVPSVNTQSPYFPTSESTTPNAPPSLKVQTIVLGTRLHRSSLLARPRSSITWPLDGAAKFFATRYGIPAGRPLADVTIRVKLGEKTVHERAHVKSGELIDLVKLPLGSAKSLTLEVDYGDAYDVQDDLYWLDPALLSQ